MVASSIDPQTECKSFSAQAVGSNSYLNRHNAQMFSEGRSFSGNERNKLFLNRGDASFLDASALSAADSPNDGRAVVAADFDDDGDVDLFVHNLQRERHSLYRNDLAGGGFLKLRLEGRVGNTEAVGATVVVSGPRGPVAQVLSRGDGYSSCHVPELVFGLGDASEAEVVVRWPGGAVETFGSLEAGSRATLVEGTGEARPFPQRPSRLRDPLPAGLRLGVGDRVPDFRVVDRDGAEVVIEPRALANGSELYLNFWASYCGPCVAELPLLDDLDEREDAAVITISADGPGRREQAVQLLTERAGRLPAYFFGTDELGEGELGSIDQVVDAARLPIPTTLVLSSEGVITKVIRGPLRAD